MDEVFKLYVYMSDHIYFICNKSKNVEQNHDMSYLSTRIINTTDLYIWIFR